MANEKRLIDANMLKANFPVLEKAVDDLWPSPVVRRAIDNAPTVDAVVLSCNIGDTVWCIMADGNIVPMVVQYIYISSKGRVRYHAAEAVLHKNFREKGIGLDVFLTEDEAKAAIGERREGK